MAHFLCHLGCSHFGALLLDFYFTENTDKYINCKGTPETPYIVAFGSITELSEITV